VEECYRAGVLLRRLGYEFDEAHCSVLRRAAKSLFALLDGGRATYIPMHMHWHLNERHYGALQVRDDDDGHGGGDDGGGGGDDDDDDDDDDDGLTVGRV
jgi:bisphosphoglycerate-dependent phosphoglycerate mutase